MAEGREQLILIDTGNTNTVFGVFIDGEMVADFRLSTDRARTADEWGALLIPLFARLELEPRATSGMLISSVVPPLDGIFRLLAASFFEVEPMFIEPGIKTGMPIRYDNPAEVGADRIVNAVGARERYGSPVLVVDFGTATTFDIVDASGAYIGGIIAPGIGISAEALFAHTSRLFRVDVRRPPRLIGRTTANAIQSGLYWGYVGLVDGILSRLLDELPKVERIVATGGQAALIAEASAHIDTVDPMITLYGLQLIYERNRDRFS